MDHALIMQVASIFLLLAMAVVVVSDVTRYIIPNTLNAAILVAYVGAAFALPCDPWSAIAAAALVLTLGLASFALGLMGGGDAKLLFVLTLWTGWGMATLQFLFMTALVGGILVLVILPLRRLLPPLLRRNNPERAMPRILIRREPVPYGLAIAGAFAWVLLRGEIPMLGQGI